MKMYLVYASNYGECAWESDATEVLGLYTDLEKAKNRVQALYDWYMQETDFVLDTESNIETLKENECIRLFYREQENWSVYFEVHIEEIKAE